MLGSERGICTRKSCCGGLLACGREAAIVALETYHAQHEEHVDLHEEPTEVAQVVFCVPGSQDAVHGGLLHSFVDLQPRHSHLAQQMFVLSLYGTPHVCNPVPWEDVAAAHTILRNQRPCRPLLALLHLGTSVKKGGRCGDRGREIHAGGMLAAGWQGRGMEGGGGAAHPVRVSQRVFLLGVHVHDADSHRHAREVFEDHCQAQHGDAEAHGDLCQRRGEDRGPDVDARDEADEGVHQGVHQRVEGGHDKADASHDGEAAFLASRHAVEPQGGSPSGRTGPARAPASQTEHLLKTFNEGDYSRFSLHPGSRFKQKWLSYQLGQPAPA